ncbi:unnamed protein product [Closterium sp. NIES-65]|nr:unnamed protein product [Closterium sp. NIES-65]
MGTAFSRLLTAFKTLTRSQPSNMTASVPLSALPPPVPLSALPPPPPPPLYHPLRPSPLCHLLRPSPLCHPLRPSPLCHPLCPSSLCHPPCPSPYSHGTIGKRTSVPAWHVQIIHSILGKALWAAGIVPSPVSATLPQITSRLFLVWGVLYLALQVLSHLAQVLRRAPRAEAACHSLSSPHPPVLASSPSAPVLSSLPPFNPTPVRAMRACQIVRYSFFAVKEAFGFTPAPLLWLRYHTLPCPRTPCPLHSLPLALLAAHNPCPIRVPRPPLDHLCVFASSHFQLLATPHAIPPFSSWPTCFSPSPPLCATLHPPTHTPPMLLCTPPLSAISFLPSTISLIPHRPARTRHNMYSMFYVFYPSGITSEVGLAFLPLPYLKVRLAL